MADRKVFIEIELNEHGAIVKARQLDAALDNVGKKGGASATVGLGKLEAMLLRTNIAGNLVARVLERTAEAIVGAFVNTLQRAVKLSSDFNNALIGLSSIASAFGVNIGAARQAAVSLAQDGLMKVSETAMGLKNLLATGFGLDQAIIMMNRFKDTAAFSRQASFDFGTAVVRATEGIRLGLSTVSDAAGMTKNLGQILEENGKKASDLSRLNSDASVRQALFNGILKETAAELGNASKLLGTYSGGVSRLSTAWDMVLISVGDAITQNQTVIQLLNQLTGILIDVNGQLMNKSKMAMLVSDAVLILVRSLGTLATGLDIIMTVWDAFWITVRNGAGALMNLTNAALAMGEAAAFMSGQFERAAQIQGWRDALTKAHDELDRRNVQTTKRNVEWGATLAMIAQRAEELAAKLEVTRGKLAEVEVEQKKHARDANSSGDADAAATKKLADFNAELARSVRELKTLGPAQVEQIALLDSQGASAEQIALKMHLAGLTVKAALESIKEGAKASADQMKNLAEMTEWVADAQQKMKDTQAERAISVSNQENIDALQALTVARQQAEDAHLTGIDAEIKAIERRRDAEIAAIQAENQMMQWNKDERIRLATEAADREIQLRRGLYSQVERLANANNVKTKAQLQDEWALSKMFLDFMLQNRTLFTDRVIAQQRRIVKGAKDNAEDEGIAWQEMFGKISEYAGAVSDIIGQFQNETMQQIALIARGIENVFANLAEGDWVGAIVAGVTTIVQAFGDALTVSPGEDVARRVATSWGIPIGEKLGDQIAETAKRVFGGDRFAAELASMQDIIKQGAADTGVSPDTFIKTNFDTLMSQLRNVFALVEMGTINVQQAGKILDDNFESLRKAGTDAYGFISVELRETIRLTQQLGVESKAVQDFLKAQSTQISSGLADIAKGTLGIGVAAQDNIGKMTEQLATAQDRAARLQAQITDLSKKPRSEWTAGQVTSMELWKRQLIETKREIETLTTNLGIAKQQVEDFAKTGQEGFDRFGRLAAVTFNAGLASGKSFVDMINEMGPALDVAADAQDQFGLKASGAFKDLLDIRRFIKDHKELAGTLDGVNKMMVGLANSNLLTQETFTDLTHIATDTFDKMVKGGLTGNQALMLMQPTLQGIWQMQQDFGFEVDEATQRLIDQGKEAGIVGEQHRSASDKMVKALERVVTVLEAMAYYLGVVIPDKAEEAGKAIGDIPLPEVPGSTGPWSERDPTKPGNTPPATPDYYPEPGVYTQTDIYGHRGGYVGRRQILHDGDLARAAMPMGSFHSGGDVPAWLQEGEFVLRKSMVDAIGVNKLRALNSGHADIVDGDRGPGRGGSGPSRSAHFTIQIGNETIADIAWDGTNASASVYKKAVKIVRGMEKKRRA
jgi:hypothetical protein